MIHTHPLFAYFREISQIPRASYKESRIADYLVAFARTHGLPVYRDEAHNVLITAPASDGMDSAAPILLQGHTDMVCEKNEATVHDFDTDPIKLVWEDGFVRADGTTLGADNGYAVAAMLSILSDPDIPHPPLECLFTTAEEVGMDGMRAFDKSRLRAKLMLNLDSCSEEYATAACAGGVRTTFTRAVSSVSCSAHALRLFVTGLMGGHSGEEIQRNRGNALKISARLLDMLSEMDGFTLFSMRGGSKDNAIPRECTSVFRVNDLKAAIEKTEELVSLIRAELSSDDSAFTVTLTEEPAAAPAMDADSAYSLIRLLRTVPCGVLRMSPTIPELVETSSNTAVLHADAESISLTVSSRSSVESQLDDVMRQMETAALLCGFGFAHRSRYPGWAFRTDSKLQKIYVRAAREVLHIEPRIIGIHAGLECGLLYRERPDMDMLSIGPDMHDIHTPQEKMSLASAVRIYDLTCHILRLLCQ